MSKYNDLEKIINFSDNKIIKKIPSPNYYYNYKQKKIYRIIKNKDIAVNKYSLLGFNSPINRNHAYLIKLKSGHIALRIPYTKLFILYKE